VEAAIPTSL